MISTKVINVLENIKIKTTEVITPRTTREIIASKGLTLTEVKEAYKIRNAKVENFAAIDKQPSNDVFRAVGAERTIHLDVVEKCPFNTAEMHIHNHPTHLIKANLTIKNFSFQDIRALIAGNQLKDGVSTFDTLFILSKRTFKDLNKKTFEVISQKNILKSVESKFKLQREALHVHFEKELEKMGIDCKKLTAEHMEKIKTTDPERAKLLKDMLNKVFKDYDDLHDEAIREIAQKTNLDYNQYKWEELLPNVLKSRGKLIQTSEPKFI